MTTRKKQSSATMKAIEIRDGVLLPATRDIPVPAKGEVQVRVHAAGVNRPDLLQRKGMYPPPAGITDIPGLEVAGEVIALGAGVRGLKKGAKVCALIAGGGYAQYVCVPAVQCLPVPKGMSMTEAAALPETFFTVWRNVVDLGKLKKRETLLVHGGNSGIGTTAIQIAKVLGASVIATVRGEKKALACLDLGADYAIEIGDDGFVDAVMAITKGRGVDVVLDMLGGDTLGKNLEVMATAARHVSIASMTGRTATVDIRTVMQKNLTLTGSTLRPQSVAAKGTIARKLKAKIWPALAKGAIRPVIAKTFPLAKAQAAHDYLESGKVTGKIVLIVR